MVAGCWSFVVLGAPFVVYWIWRRSRGVRNTFPIGKWWFACLMLLLAAEPTAAIIKVHRELMHIPVLAPAPEGNEFHIAAIGESSMLGWPYVTRDDGDGVFEPRFGIPAVYAWRLQQLYPA
jgi:hypothetical protein